MKTCKAVSLAVLLVLASIMAAGCGKSLQQRIDQAKGSMADQDVKAEEKAEQEAQNDYLDEWQAFRGEAEKQVAANDKDLEHLKAKSAAAGGKEGAAITDLQQKNDKLKGQLQGYRDEGKVGWDAFKRDFTHEMDSLSKAIIAVEAK